MVYRGSVSLSVDGSCLMVEVVCIVFRRIVDWARCDQRCSGRHARWILAASRLQWFRERGNGKWTRSGVSDICIPPVLFPASDLSDALMNPSPSPRSQDDIQTHTPPPVVEWEKVLWRRQPFPDHHVPPSFLAELNELGASHQLQTDSDPTPPQPLDPAHDYPRCSSRPYRYRNTSR